MSRFHTGFEIEPSLVIQNWFKRFCVQTSLISAFTYQYFSRYAQNVPPKHILTKWNLQQLWQRTQCN